MSKKHNRYKIGAINLEKTVNALFIAYGQDVNQVLYSAMKETAEEAVKELKAVNHFSDKGNPSGEYAASWTTTEQQAKSRFGKSIVVNNEEHYRLTHLLEFGHALKRGGRVYGSVRAYPHIYGVEQKVVKKLESEVIERIVDLKTV